MKKPGNSRPIKRLATIVVLVWTFSLCAREGTGAGERPATIGELQVLFDLAFARDARSQFVADIETITRPPSQRTGGDQIRHVAAWFSGRASRIDETMENPEAPWVGSSNVYRETFVHAYDTSLSPYPSFAINRQLKTMSVSKDPKRYFRFVDDFWRISGMDEKLEAPLINALIDRESIDKKTLHEPGVVDKTRLVNSFKMDERKAERLAAGRQLTAGANSNQLWSLTAHDEAAGGRPTTRFTLHWQAAKYPSAFGGPQDDEINYWVTQIAGRPVLLRGALTNSLSGDSYEATRDQFDDHGFAHVWRRTEVRQGAVTEYVITFKEIDLTPSFSDKSIFPAPAFPADYLIYEDRFPETAVVLQNPSSHPDN